MPIPHPVLPALTVAAGLLLAGCLSSGAPNLLPGLGDPLAAPGAGPLSALSPVPIATHDHADFETDVAVNPRDPDHIVVLYIEIPGPVPTGSTVTSPVVPGMFFLALATTHDGGDTWQRRVVPFTGQAPLLSGWTAWCVHGDPNAFFDADGLLHVVMLAISCGGPGYTGAEAVVHATTADDGATWSEPHIVFPSAGGVLAVFHDRQWSAMDPATGRIGVVWTKFEAVLQRATLTASFSTDGGRKWSLPEEIESGLLFEPELRNWLVHATWAADGRFHITGLGPTPDRLVHWAGQPGGPWERADLPLSDCPGAPAYARFGYASSASDFHSGRIWAASAAVGKNPPGICVWTSADGGATWPTAAWFPNANHTWLALAPGGDLAMAHLALDPGDPDLATPTLALLDPATLQVRSRAPMGPAHHLRPQGEDMPVYGHYDAMAAHGDGFLWALTVPDPDSNAVPVASDVVAYRVALKDV